MWAETCGLEKFPPDVIVLCFFLYRVLIPESVANKPIEYRPYFRSSPDSLSSLNFSHELNRIFP